MRWVSRLVTVAVVVAVIGGVGLWIYSRVPSSKVGGGFITWTMFRDGSRLAVGSPVVIAGVRIGDITKLSIEGKLARVDMRLVDDIQLPVDSFATRRADSLFGDSYIEIIPGGQVAGAETARMLRSGEPIANVQEGGSTDTVLRGIARAMPKLDNGLDTLHRFMVNGRKWVRGPLDTNLQAADHWIAGGHIQSPLATAESAMGRVESATTTGAEALAKASPDIRSALTRWVDATTRAKTGIVDANAAVVTAMKDARDSLDRLDPTVAQMAEVITAIDRGEGEDWKGTLGRIVNDPSTADAIEDAAASGAEAVHGFNRFKAWIGARVELNIFSQKMRFYATAEVRSRTDKLYLIELERGPLGDVPDDSLSEVTGTGEYVRRQVIRDKLRFTAQFGKVIGFMQIRGGLKDSTFGFGGDALLMSGRLRLSADIFGAYQPTPRLKLSAALAVFRSIYVVAGVDDALNAPGYLPIVTGSSQVPDDYAKVRYGRDYFVGASLHFDDADLSTLLRVYGALLVGLL